MIYATTLISYQYTMEPRIGDCIAFSMNPDISRFSHPQIPRFLLYPDRIYYFLVTLLLVNNK